MNRLRRALQRRRAIEAAAIVIAGGGRDGNGYWMTPQERWPTLNEHQRKLSIAKAEETIQAFEEVMREVI